MTTFKPPARLPARELFEASVAIALSIRNYVEIDFLTSDIPAIEHAVTRLSSVFGIPVAWSMGPPAAITLEPFDGLSKVASMKYLRTLMADTPGWKNRAAEGMKPKIVRIFEQLRTEQEVRDRIKAIETHKAACARKRIASAVGPIGVAPMSTASEGANNANL